MRLCDNCGTVTGIGLCPACNHAPGAPPPAGISSRRAKSPSVPWIPNLDSGGIGWLLFFSCIPLLGLIPLRGWWLSVVRARCQGGNPELPYSEDVPAYWREGFAITVIQLIFGLPVLVMFVFEITHYLSLIAQTMAGQLDFFDALGEFAMAFIIQWSVTTVYQLLTSAWLLAGALTYLQHPRWSVFFSTRPVRLIWKNRMPFAVLVFKIAFVKIAFWLGSILLLCTGIGAILIPTLAIPAYFWTNALLAGQFGVRHREGPTPLGIA
jgi:hypothetical protein